ncbi:MAG: VOC family protein [Pirellulaceae bacterium]|nr:VOC family protein [Pirellulaceae bacterium]
MTASHEPATPAVGSIAWRDLTVPEADSVRNFYEQVVGWKSSPVDLGGYSDFEMLQPSSGESVAGICHARGSNADIPPQWLIYIIVADVAASAARCVELGGQVIIAPRPLSGGTFCVIRDPAGAVCALFQSG